MCGDELPASSYAHRFGALAIMGPPISPSPSAASFASSPSTASRASSPDMSTLSGSIAFFNDTDHNCQVATHVRFSPSGTLPAGGCPCLLLNIHDFGDVRLEMPDVSTTTTCGPILHRLRVPLHLHVGEDRHGNKGIIGRRVTMYRAPLPGYSRTSDMALSEGIVGFNSLPRTDASL